MIRAVLTRAVPWLGALAVLAPVPPARACMCAPPPPLVAIGSADAVFSGTVIRVLDPREGERVQSGGDPIEYAFAIDTVWKGVFRDTAVVYSARSGATCGFVFLPGETYLVLAKDRRGFLWTGMCTGTGLLESAAVELSVLAGLPVTGSAERVDRAIVEALIGKAGSASSESTRVAAFWALGAVGKLPGRAIPFLAGVARTGGEHERAQAVRAVALFDDGRARKAVVDGLDDPSVLVRQCAVVALSGYDEDEEFVLPLYLKGLQDPEAQVRATTCTFIQSLRSSADAVVPRLMALLSDEDERVRGSAARALSSFPEESGNAVPDLLAALPDTSALVRAAVLSSIAVISEDDSLVTELLVRGMEDGDARVRGEALSRFTDRRFKFAPAADRAHLRALGDADVDLRRRGADYFGVCCPERRPRPFLESEELLVALSRAAGDTSVAVRAAAVRALGEVNRPPEVLPHLIEALGDPEAEVRLRALASLRLLGPAARIALPRIRSLRDDPDEGVRWQAGRTEEFLEGSE